MCIIIFFILYIQFLYSLVYPSESFISLFFGLSIWVPQFLYSLVYPSEFLNFFILWSIHLSSFISLFFGLSIWVLQFFSSFVYPSEFLHFFILWSIHLSSSISLFFGLSIWVPQFLYSLVHLLSSSFVHPSELLPCPFSEWSRIYYNVNCPGIYFFYEISVAAFNFKKFVLFFWNIPFLLFLSSFAWWDLLLILQDICSFLFLQVFWCFPNLAVLFLLLLFFFLFSS